MDDADKAEDRQQEILSDALAKVRRKSSMIACGFCHWCGETTLGVFCSTECRDDHDNDQKMRRINGTA